MHLLSGLHSSPTSLYEYIPAMPRRASIAIHILLAAQLLLPMHYYACNSDKRDERFAWRMFSPTRIEKCSAQFFLGDVEQAIRTTAFFHSAWIGIAQRGRQSVISAMAQRLCDDNPNMAVRVRVQCEQAPGVARTDKRLLYDPSRTESDDQIEMVSRGVFDFCTIGAL